MTAIEAGDAAPGETERALLLKGATFKQEIQTAQAALPKNAPATASSAKPTPFAPLLAPSATPVAGPPQHS